MVRPLLLRGKREENWSKNRGTSPIIKDHDITLVLSGLKRQVIQVMRQTLLFDHIGQENIFATEDMALADIYKRMGGEGEFCPLSPDIAAAKSEEVEARA